MHRFVGDTEATQVVHQCCPANPGDLVGGEAEARRGSAGELAAAVVYILVGGMTVQRVANSWAPYLTMAEGVRIACQSYSTDVSRLSCCAV